MQFIYLFLGQCLIFFCHYEFIRGNPINGHPVRLTPVWDFPYIVSLVQIQPNHTHSEGQHYCTGVLITRNDILTAAYCVEYEILNRIQLIINTIDFNTGTVLHPFWWETYDQWAVIQNKTLDYYNNNIANIRILERAADHLVPARLSRLSNTDLYNTDVKVVGWGEKKIDIIPGMIYYADLKIIENNECEQNIERAEGRSTRIDIRILCTYKAPYVLVTRADSGGPLIYRDRLIGINHGVCPIDPEIRDEDKINLHISIDYYRNFINYMKKVR